MSATLSLLGMAVITFFIKATIFILGDRGAFSPTLRRALEPGTARSLWPGWRCFLAGSTG